MTKQQRFEKAYNCLKTQGLVSKQEDLANLMGTSVSNVSSALRGVDKFLTDGFIIRFVESTKFLFNLEWLLFERGTMEDKTPVTDIDQSSQVNAIIAGRDMAITEARSRIDDLKRQLEDLRADKDALIESLRQQLSDKEKIISAKDELIANLRAKIKSYKISDYGYDLPKVAEEDK